MPNKKLKSQNSKVKISVQKPKVAVNKKAPVKKVVAQKTVEKKTGLNADIYDIHGKVVSKMQLPKEIFGAKINNQLMAQAVRVYLANQKQGTAATKTRGEVNYSTRKLWRQKGTGRARHGSAKAPIFVHGGVAHGPKPRDYSLKLPKKMKKASLFSALSLKHKAKEIKFVAGLEKIDSKTKIMAGVIKNLEIDGKRKKILLVTTSPSKNGLENLYKAARNIKGLNTINANTLNTYEVLDNKAILMMKDAVDGIKSNFLKGGD